MLTDGTVTCEVYLILLSDEFFPFLMGYRIPMNEAQFQLDGVRHHTRNAALCLLHDVFKETVQSNRCPVQFEEGFLWPPTSLYFNPCYYILWRYLKYSVFQKIPHTIPGLKTTMQSETEVISAEL